MIRLFGKKDIKFLYDVVIKKVNKLNSLKISNYKSIGENSIGFNEINKFNIIIGKNNIGKSSLLDIFNYLTNDTYRIHDHYRPVITFKINLSQEDIASVFLENTSGGGINMNHYQYGKRFIESTIRYKLKLTQQKLSNSIRWKYDDIDIDEIRSPSSESLNLETIPELAKQKLVSIAKGFITRFKQKYYVIKLSADRDLIPENVSEELDVGLDGLGATNAVRAFINRSDLNSDIVEKDILHQLNEIMIPDNYFNRILIQQLTDDENPKWEIFLEENNQKIPLSDYGSGLRTILLTLIKINIEAKLNETTRKTPIFIFEELENNLHPTTVRNLMRFLYKWTDEKGIISYYTTHSNVSLDMLSAYDNVSVLNIYKNDEEVVAQQVNDFNTKTFLIDDLGINASDILQSNVLIWVEGPTDRIYINKWLSLYTQRNSLEPFTENVHYQFIFYGGKLLSNYKAEMNEDEIEDFINILTINRHSIIVMDSDRQDSNKRIGQTKKRIEREIEGSNGYAWITDGREIENYLTNQNFIDTLDLNVRIGKFQRIENLLNENTAKLGDKYQKNKKKYSLKFIENMTYSDFKNNYNLEEHIENIFLKIKHWNH